ncbi:hypothetical protein [Streptomyces phaeochromogenes]
MDENVVTALVAAGAAIGGGAMTGVFTLAAAKRQAAAAWEAGRQQATAAWDSGQLQATAQLDVARRTLTEQTLANQRAVLRATALGASDAWTKPGGVREQLGDTSAVERAYVRGCEAGDTEAYAVLGSLYLDQGRSHEACAAYRSAVDAGLPDVWEGLLAALATQTPRATSAQTASRLRRTGLSEER